MTDRHLDGLATLITVFSITRDPWCIVAGAATALHTGDWRGVQDIDVIVSVEDARRLIASGAVIDRTDGGSAPYRSVVYATINAPMPIDLFAGFEIHSGGEWWPVAPTPTPFETPVGTVYVPNLREQLDITRRLGRPKDLARIWRLENLLQTSP